jgi:ABC-2 type transport system ATP-binding protein
MRRKTVKTGPGFEWLADDAQWRSARSYPPPKGTPVVGEGSGLLVVSPADVVSGTPMTAAPALNALNVPIPAATAQVVGRPRLSLTYSGTGNVTHVFAQIIDETRNLAVGNQVTPLPVQLDGAQHTITRQLEGIAASLAPGRTYRLQLIGGSQVYGPVRGAAAITFASARIALPTASP